MFIQTKFDLFLMVMTIILAGSLGGMLTGFYLDALDGARAKDKKEKTDKATIVPKEEVVVRAEEVTDTTPEDKKMGVIRIPEGSNVRYQDGEKVYFGGKEFLEGVNYNLNNEVAMYDQLDLEA